MAIACEYSLNTEKGKKLSEITLSIYVYRKIQKELEQFENKKQTKKELTLWD